MSIRSNVLEILTKAGKPLTSQEIFDIYCGLDEADTYPKTEEQLNGSLYQMRHDDVCFSAKGEGLKRVYAVKEITPEQLKASTKTPSATSTQTKKKKTAKKTTSSRAPVKSKKKTTKKKVAKTNTSPKRRPKGPAGREGGEQAPPSGIEAILQEAFDNAATSFDEYVFSVADETILNALIESRTAAKAALEAYQNGNV